MEEIFTIFILFIQSTNCAVSVSCSHATITLVVSFEDPFYGLVSTRPLANCSVQGHGKYDSKLIILLDEKTRKKCSIVEYNDEYVGVVSIQMHSKLSMKGDTSYLVRCPIHDPNGKNETIGKMFTTTTTVSPHLLNRVNMQILEEKEKQDVAKVGQNYDMKLAIPFKGNLDFNIRIGPCIAFTGTNELKILQLTDNEGCPVSKELIHEFKQEYDISRDRFPTSINYNAKIKMFNFGNSSHFYLQCQMLKCSDNDGNCIKGPDCNSNTKPQNFTSKLLHLNKLHASYTSMRIDIDPSYSPHPQSPTPYCQISAEEKTILAITIVILSMLSSATWIVAYYNLPDNLLKIWKKLKNKVLFKSISLYKDIKYEVSKRLHHTNSLSETTSTTSSYHIRVDKSHIQRRVDFINLDDEIDKIMYDAIKPTPPERKSSRLHISTRSFATPLHESKNDGTSQEGSIVVSLGAEIDKLPEPPSITLKEIDELNKAFNNEYETPKVSKIGYNNNSTPKVYENLKNMEENFEKLSLGDDKSLDIDITKSSKEIKRTSTLDLPMANKILRKETMDVPIEKSGPQYVTDWRNIRPVISPHFFHYKKRLQTENYITKIRSTFEPIQNTSVDKLDLSEEKLLQAIKSLGTKNKMVKSESVPEMVQISTTRPHSENSFERPRSANEYYLKNSSVETNIIA